MAQIQDKWALAVHGVLTRTKTPLCDACVNKSAKVNNVTRVSDMTAAFGVTNGFTRSISECSLCAKRLQVTTYA